MRGGSIGCYINIRGGHNKVIGTEIRVNNLHTGSVGVRYAPLRNLIECFPLRAELHFIALGHRCKRVAVDIGCKKSDMLNARINSNGVSRAGALHINRHKPGIIMAPHIHGVGFAGFQNCRAAKVSTFSRIPVIGNTFFAVINPHIGVDISG